MSKVLQGLAFILINFSIDIGVHRIGIFPAFIGYIYLIQGFAQMSDKSEWFKKGSLLMKAMVPISVIAYMNDLLGFSYRVRGAAYIFGIIGALASIYSMYLCVMGVNDIQYRTGRDLNGSMLRKLWAIMAMADMIAYVGGDGSAVSGVAGLVGVIVMILFLVKFKQTKDSYYQAGML